jgi:universal stress protein A
MQTYKHLLLAADFAPDSELVTERAFALKALFETRLSLIHVVDYLPPAYVGEFVPPYDLDLEENLVDRAREKLAALAKQHGDADAAQYVEIGSPKAEIIRVAAENEVDLIVVGSHGRRGLALLLGSTANAVLHRAPCDVLTVRFPTQHAGT